VQSRCACLPLTPKDSIKEGKGATIFVKKHDSNAWGVDFFVVAFVAVRRRGYGGQAETGGAVIAGVGGSDVGPRI
jgi:hypothetical protein